MALDSSVIGKQTGAYRVTVERGPVSNFARALKEENPVYHDPAAADAAGFAGIPAPPTWSFAMQFWGRFAEDQPEDPTGGENPMHKVMGELFAKGGLVLHGEQEFEYHRRRPRHWTGVRQTVPRRRRQGGRGRDQRGPRRLGHGSAREARRRRLRA